MNWNSKHTYPVPDIAQIIPKFPNNTFFPSSYIITWETKPFTGKIEIWISASLKNENKLWYNTGSPAPIESKKAVLEFRSNNNLVIVPAKTGKDNSYKIIVIKTCQGRKVTLSKSKITFFSNVISIIIY